MKKRLATLLLTFVTITVSAFAHGDNKIGPNGGRLIQFSDKNPIRAEFVMKGEQFIITLFDHVTKKEIPVTGQQLTITHKEANKKLAPELKAGKWTVSKPAGDDFWLIVQLRENTGAKSMTGRLHYDAAKCPACGEPEWLCRCAEEQEPAKKE
jgi:hypothetical protein